MLFALLVALAIGVALAFVSANLSWLARRVDGVPAFRPRSAFALGFAGSAAGLGSHLFADVLMIPIGDNPMEPLWPFSHETVALSLMHPGDPTWNYGLLAAGILVQAVVFVVVVDRRRRRGRSLAARESPGESNRSD